MRIYICKDFCSCSFSRKVLAREGKKGRQVLYFVNGFQKCPLEFLLRFSILFRECSCVVVFLAVDGWLVRCYGDRLQRSGFAGISIWLEVVVGDGCRRWRIVMKLKLCGE